MLDWILLKVEIYILTSKLFCIVTWLVRGHWRIELKVFTTSVLLQPTSSFKVCLPYLNPWWLDCFVS